MSFKKYNWNWNVRVWISILIGSMMTILEGGSQAIGQELKHGLEVLEKIALDAGSLENLIRKPNFRLSYIEATAEYFNLEASKKVAFSDYAITVFSELNEKIQKHPELVSRLWDVRSDYGQAFEVKSSLKSSGFAFRNDTFLKHPAFLPGFFLEAMARIPPEFFKESRRGSGPRIQKRAVDLNVVRERVDQMTQRVSEAHQLSGKQKASEMARLRSSSELLALQALLTLAYFEFEENLDLLHSVNGDVVLFESELLHKSVRKIPFAEKHLGLEIPFELRSALNLESEYAYALTREVRNRFDEARLSRIEFESIPSTGNGPEEIESANQKKQRVIDAANAGNPLFQIRTVVNPLTGKMTLERPSGSTTFVPVHRSIHGILKGFKAGECNRKACHRWLLPAVEGLRIYFTESSSKKMTGYIHLIPGASSLNQKIYGALEVMTPATNGIVNFFDETRGRHYQLSSYDLAIDELYKQLPREWSGLVTSDGDHANNAGGKAAVYKSTSWVFGEKLDRAQGYLLVKDPIAAIFGGDIVSDGINEKTRNIVLLKPKSQRAPLDPKEYRSELLFSYLSTKTITPIQVKLAIENGWGVANETEVLDFLRDPSRLEDINVKSLYQKLLDRDLQLYLSLIELAPHLGLSNRKIAATLDSELILRFIMRGLRHSQVGRDFIGEYRQSLENHTISKSEGSLALLHLMIDLGQYHPKFVKELVSRLNGDEKTQFIGIDSYREVLVQWSERLRTNVNRSSIGAGFHGLIWFMGQKEILPLHSAFPIADVSKALAGRNEFWEVSKFIFQIIKAKQMVAHQKFWKEQESQRILRPTFVWEILSRYLSSPDSVAEYFVNEVLQDPHLREVIFSPQLEVELSFQLQRLAPGEYSGVLKKLSFVLPPQFLADLMRNLNLHTTPEKMVALIHEGARRNERMNIREFIEQGEKGLVNSELVLSALGHRILVMTRPEYDNWLQDLGELNASRVFRKDAFVKGVASAIVESLTQIQKLEHRKFRWELMNSGQVAEHIGPYIASMSPLHRLAMVSSLLAQKNEFFEAIFKVLKRDFDFLRLVLMDLRQVEMRGHSFFETLGWLGPHIDEEEKGAKELLRLRAKEIQEWVFGSLAKESPVLKELIENRNWVIVQFEMQEDFKSEFIKILGDKKANESQRVLRQILTKNFRVFGEDEALRQILNSKVATDLASNFSTDSTDLYSIHSSYGSKFNHQSRLGMANRVIAAIVDPNPTVAEKAIRFLESKSYGHTTQDPFYVVEMVRKLREVLVNFPTVPKIEWRRRIAERALRKLSGGSCIVTLSKD